MAFFVQAMLSKVSNATISWTFNILVEPYNKTVSAYASSGVDYVYETLSFNADSGNYNVELKSNTSSDSRISLNDASYIMKDTNNNQVYCANGWSYTWTVSFTKWATVKVVLYSQYGRTIDWTVRIYKYLNTIWKKIFTKKCLPRQLKAIWENATGTLFGYHTDNTRYTGE